MKKGSGEEDEDEEEEFFVGIFDGYKARPMEKVVSLVREMMEDSRVVLPSNRRFEEVKLRL